MPKVLPLHPYVRQIREDEMINWNRAFGDSILELPNSHGVCGIEIRCLRIEVFELKDKRLKRQGHGLADMRLLRPTWKGQICAMGVDTQAPGPKGFWLRCLSENLIDGIAFIDGSVMCREDLPEYQQTT